MCETTARPLPPGIEPISGEEARRLIRLTEGLEFEALLDRAEAARRAVHGHEISLCGITNAKSGQGLTVRPTPDAAHWAFHGDAPAETRWNRRAAEGRRALPVVR
jgi:hypothetical protein